MHLAALALTTFLALAAPEATTGPAESVTTGSAAVTGTVDPNGEATTYQIQYGTSTSYGLTSAAQDAGSGTEPVPIKVTLTGLTQNTTYHYRVVATNASGPPVEAADRTFKTATPARPHPRSPAFLPPA